MLDALVSPRWGCDVIRVVQAGRAGNVVRGPYRGDAADYPSHSCSGLNVAEGEVALCVYSGSAHFFAEWAVGTEAELRAWLPTSRHAQRWFDPEAGRALGAAVLLAALDRKVSP